MRIIKIRQRVLVTQYVRNTKLQECGKVADINDGMYLIKYDNGKMEWQKEENLKVIID